MVHAKSPDSVAAPYLIDGNPEVKRLRILLQAPYNDRPEIFRQYGIDPELYAAATPDSHIEMHLSCSA